jgi:hypothetical protein
MGFGTGRSVPIGRERSLRSGAVTPARSYQSMFDRGVRSTSVMLPCSVHGIPVKMAKKMGQGSPAPAPFTSGEISLHR